MSRAPYPTDLSDAECAYLAPYLPPPASRGRPRLRPLREILDAIFYVVRTGCQWRLLPRELPPWQTIYHYFRLWRLDGTRERLNAGLVQRLRVRAGRDPAPCLLHAAARFRSRLRTCRRKPAEGRSGQE